MIRKTHVLCDGFGCEERFPLEHEYLGEPGFGTGRWPGWVFLDINREDLRQEPYLAFCSTFCLKHWLDRETINRGRKVPTDLDRAIRAPYDETARARAGLRKKVAR